MTLPPADEAFFKSLALLIRAQDSAGVWDSEPDAALLAPFIVTKEQRRAIPLMGEPDPDILWRVELFYGAIGLGIEKRTGHNAAPLMKIHHEGWGRMILTAGKLVVVNAYLRDLHRFGFESLEAMAAKANGIIQDAVALIEKFPEVASA